MRLHLRYAEHLGAKPFVILAPEVQVLMHGRMVTLMVIAGIVCGGIANACAFFILSRMESLGFSVGLWRWPGKDVQLYSGYWNIAPTRGWSRLPLIAAAVAMVLGVIFLFFAMLEIRKFIG
jgi:hypothetical protein